jgi:hypothetical protein
MSSRDEQRRKRRSDSFRRDEADEADNWLAGLRGSGGGDPDPFTGGPPEPAAFDRLDPLDRSGSFDRPGPLDRPAAFDRPGAADRTAPFDRTGAADRTAPFDRTGPLGRSGPLDRPSSVDRTGSFDRTGALDRPGAADRTTSIQRSRAADAPGEPRRRRARDDSPSGVFGPSALPPAPPPARPNLEGWSTPEAPTAPGRRRAVDDTPSGVYGRTTTDPASGAYGRTTPDSANGAYGRTAAAEPANGAYGRSVDESPSGVYGRTSLPATRPAAEPPAEPRGRRRAREEAERVASQSYDHGPQLTPIIKPLDELVPAVPPTEPPPLVPIFPNMRPDSSPTSGAAFRAKRSAADNDPAALAGATGDVTNGRRRTAPEDPGGRRRADSRTGDLGPRTGDLGPRTGDLGPRTGDLGPRTGDLGPRTAGLGPRTGDLGPRTGDLGPRTGDLGPRTAGLGPRTGDLGPRTGDLGPRTGDLGPRTGDLGSRTGELGGRRRTAPDEPGMRRQRTPYDDPARGFDDAPRRGIADDPRRGYDDGPRRDDAGTARRGGFAAGFPGGVEAGFEAAAPATEVGRRGDASGVRRRDEALRRRPALDEPPHQRRALDDAMPDYDPYDEPPAARRRGGRATGEYSDDYTTGGTRRALREPPGSPRSGPPGRPDRADRIEGGRGRSGGANLRLVDDPVRGPRPHRWVALLSAIAVVVVLGACGMGTWFILKDEKNGPGSANSSSASGPKKRDISTREADPKPLTEAEVFPSNNIVAVPDEPPYVILATKASNDCKVAATEELATLLANAGCTEVVRATLKSPNQEYLITAGVFNVSSEKVAAQAFDGIKPIVDGQKGRFAGMSVGAGTGTDALVRAPTQLGWNYKGHFITYCVIARVDGNNFAQGDPYPNQITFDIVETYLDNGIIENRAIIQPEATPAASLPAR